MTPHLIIEAASSTLGPGGTSVSLPGTSLLQGIATAAVIVVEIVAVLALLISAAAMALGHHINNSRVADKGRTGLIAALVAAVVAGAAWALVNFAFAAGGKIH